MTRSLWVVLMLSAAWGPAFCAVPVRAGCGADGDQRAMIETALADRTAGAYERAWLYRDRGLLEFAAGRYSAAVRDFDRSLDIDPRACPSALRLRGLARFAAGQYDEAALDFDSCGALPGDPAGMGIGAAEPPSEWSIAPRLWSHLARLRAGRGDGNVLSDYIEYISTPSGAAAGQEEPVEAECGWMIEEDDSDDRDGPAEFCLDVVHSRLLAMLFLGRCRADGYYTAVESVLDPLRRGGDLDDAQEAAGRRSAARRLDALRAFYLGQYWLLRGDAQQARRWLSRAADYDGPPDPEWPVVGRGSLAVVELARLCGGTTAKEGDPGLAIR